MKRFFTGMIFLGIVILLGTAGASDVGSIGLSQVCAQGIGAVLFLFTGMLGQRVCHIREVQMRRMCRLEKMDSRSSANRTYVLNGDRKMREIA